MDQLLLKPCATCGAPPAKAIDYGGIMVINCSRKAVTGETNCMNRCGKTLELAVERWDALPPQELKIGESLKSMADRILGPQGSRRRPRTSGRTPSEG